MSMAIAETRLWSLGTGGPRLHCSGRTTGSDVTLEPVTLGAQALRAQREMGA
jgi:hypothetical protein